MTVEEIIKNTGFNICHKNIEPAKPAESMSYDDLNLSNRALAFLKGKNIPSLWSHQHRAIQESKAGKNVCVTTSTSSGKTEIFQLAAMEALAKNPKGKILAVYPMKALNRQQLERWKDSGLIIGQIDGSVKTSDRLQRIKESDVLVMTPDVVHAFLLGRINYYPEIGAFIKNLVMVIIDELHLYKGLFGTNSAYLFRRLNNVRRLLRGRDDFAQYITASATMPNAVKHSSDITGVGDFIEIDIIQDGSPSAVKNILFVENDPNEPDRGNDKVADLVYELAKLDDYKSITFVESRQQVGLKAFHERIENNAEKTGIYPFRAGYEKETVDQITGHLEEGSFRGVISTSALEIGIDIDGLNVVIIADMPQDMNSYQQRIGRVGRFGCKGESYVIIVRNNQSFASNLLFTDPTYDINKVLPTYEPALYLEDENIQNIHALCHVGDHDECEYKQWKGGINKRKAFNDGGCFPTSFVKRCNDVLTGQLSSSYEKIVGCNNPHFEYPLRYFDKQFTIQLGDDDTRETVSRNQITTEAYRGAIRETMGGTKRIRQKVKYVDQREKVIKVEKENNMFKKTTAYSRKYLIPNFKTENQQVIECGDTLIYNLNVNEHCNIWGYYEITGQHREYKKYDEVFQFRPFQTTGTLFFTPAFDDAGVKTEQIAEILFETFLRRNAFDRNDINYINGKLFFGTSDLPSGSKFVAMYDASSMNMTKRIIETDRLKDLFTFLRDNHQIIAKTICNDINQQTIQALLALCNDILDNPMEFPKTNVTVKKFKSATEVKVIIRDENDPENFTEQIGTYVGTADSDGLVNIFVNGIMMYNIDLNDLIPTENTRYVEQ